jgi:hypothetical protein
MWHHDRCLKKRMQEIFLELKAWVSKLEVLTQHIHVLVILRICKNTFYVQSCILKLQQKLKHANSLLCSFILLEKTGNKQGKKLQEVSDGDSCYYIKQPRVKKFNL